MTARPPAFLDILPPGDRSRVAGKFYAAVRAGHDSATGVLAAVFREAEQGGDEMLSLALRHSPSALGFASYVLERESAPPKQRRAMKAAAQDEGLRQAMADRPPSEKQLRFLAKLGDTKPAPATMLEASARIDALLQRERSA